MTRRSRVRNRCDKEVNGLGIDMTRKSRGASIVHYFEFFDKNIFVAYILSICTNRLSNLKKFGCTGL